MLLTEEKMTEFLGSRPASSEFSISGLKDIDQRAVTRFVNEFTNLKHVSTYIGKLLMAEILDVGSPLLLTSKGATLHSST